MTLIVGFEGADGLVLAGDTWHHREPMESIWHGYNSTKIHISDSGRIAVACARNMDFANRMAEEIFATVSDDDAQRRALQIREIGQRVAETQGVECIVAFGDPQPTLYWFACDGTPENRRCVTLDKIHIGNTGNPAYFWALRHHASSLTVAQLVRLGSQIVVTWGLAE